MSPDANRRQVLSVTATLSFGGWWEELQKLFSSAEEMDRREVEDLAHEEVNRRRRQHGLDALAFDEDLREIARDYSREMAQNGYLGHVSPNGEDFTDRYEQQDYQCFVQRDDGPPMAGGENVLYTYYDTKVNTESGTETFTTLDELAEGIVVQWMNSPEHRETLLRDFWRHEGIGIYVTDDDKVYATQNFC